MVIHSKFVAFLQSTCWTSTSCHFRNFTVVIRFTDRIYFLDREKCHWSNMLRAKGNSSRSISVNVVERMFCKTYKSLHRNWYHVRHHRKRDKLTADHSFASSPLSRHTHAYWYSKRKINTSTTRINCYKIKLRIFLQNEAR